MFYLLAFIFNVANLNPVVTKNCIVVSADNFKEIAKKSASDIETLGLSCEKNPESVVYNCSNQEKGLIGKVVVLKDQSECKKFPEKMVTDLRNLMNRK